MKNLRMALAAVLVILSLSACNKTIPQSAVDTLPLPDVMATSKDLSVKPGDSFYDYCNGNWLKNTPIPATSAVGGLYDQVPLMEERVKKLRATVPDIGRFYDLKEAASGQPELSKAYLDAQKARFPRPQTKEEAFRTMGRMLVDGVPVWSNVLMPTLNVSWEEGRLMGLLLPRIEVSMPDLPQAMEPSRMLPLSATKAGAEGSPLSLILEGAGLDRSLFVTDPNHAPYWEELAAMSLEQLCSLIDEAWGYYDQFCAEELQPAARSAAAFACAYTLSYHFAQAYLPPAMKERCLGIANEIKASLRKRIQNVEWMSETTRSAAVEKLDYCGLNVCYPDTWYTDCVTKFSECQTLVEAVHRGNRDITRMKCQLYGGSEVFNYYLTTASIGADDFIPSDLTLVNAMYESNLNCVFIFPAVLLPPVLPENVSLAYQYASFTVIGHELTHGFDSSGSQKDKFGKTRNWWTVADKMDFEERSELLVQCHNHLPLDPERAPGQMSDGKVTLAENIADLGGLLTALDAYSARLDADGFFGEEKDNQLRKFFESYADLWRMQYSDAKLATFPGKDVHSHCRLRVNGVVMNCDLWYELYGVDRNSALYLPESRRTYIW